MSKEGRDLKSLAERPAGHSANCEQPSEGSPRYVFPSVGSIPREGRLQYLSRVVTLNGESVQTIGFYAYPELARTKALEWIERYAPGGQLS